jgi:hypothetical protein
MSKEIHINEKGWIINNHARTPVNKSVNDTITWKALGQGGPWKIVFISASPFSDTSFTVPQGGSVNSGPIKANFGGTAVKFRYEVHNANGSVVDDPDVILEG